MKICNICKKDKPLEEFHKNKCKKDGLQDCCKPCCTIRDRNNRIKHREKWKIHYKEKWQEKKKWFKELKSTFSCKKCNDKRWYILDFHHLDPSKKDINVSEALMYSREVILEEIKKCITLCRNCHTEFHHLEKENKITLKQYLKDENF